MFVVVVIYMNVKERPPWSELVSLVSFVGAVL